MPFIVLIFMQLIVTRLWAENLRNLV